MNYITSSKTSLNVWIFMSLNWQQILWGLYEFSMIWSNATIIIAFLYVPKYLASLLQTSIFYNRTTLWYNNTNHLRTTFDIVKKTIELHDYSRVSFPSHKIRVLWYRGTLCFCISLYYFMHYFCQSINQLEGVETTSMEYDNTKHLVWNSNLRGKVTNTIWAMLRNLSTSKKSVENSSPL